MLAVRLPVGYNQSTKAGDEMEMNYCMRCGAKLIVREHPTDGPVPYCETCRDYRYPVFSAAVSMIVVDPGETEMLLIQQYGRPHYILPAGYIDKGETAEHAVRRELMEELGLEAESLRFLGSHYYEPSETLMLNFLVTATQHEARPNFEIDSWRWFPMAEARTIVRPGGLAERLLRDLYGEYKEDKG